MYSRHNYTWLLRTSRNYLKKFFLFSLSISCSIYGNKSLQLFTCILLITNIFIRKYQNYIALDSCQPRVLECSAIDIRLNVRYRSLNSRNIMNISRGASEVNMCSTWNEYVETPDAEQRLRRMLSDDLRREMQQRVSTINSSVNFNAQRWVSTCLTFH